VCIEPNSAEKRVSSQPEAAVRRWVETVVVGLKLCPFAERELRDDRVRFVVTDAATTEDLTKSLLEEFELLETDGSIETTLLIHPNVLRDFLEYNNFLSAADELLVESGFEGTFQIASFHPEYQFSGIDPDAVENYTNRSPHPILHLIREESLSRAIDSHPDVDNIPLRNIEFLRNMGTDKVTALLRKCY